MFTHDINTEEYRVVGEKGITTIYKVVNCKEEGKGRKFSQFPDNLVKFISDRSLYDTKLIMRKLYKADIAGLFIETIIRLQAHDANIKTLELHNGRFNMKFIQNDDDFIDPGIFEYNSNYGDIILRINDLDAMMSKYRLDVRIINFKTITQIDQKILFNKTIGMDI